VDQGLKKKNLLDDSESKDSDIKDEERNGG